jgi:hypothetical protein
MQADRSKDTELELALRQGLHGLVFGTVYALDQYLMYAALLTWCSDERPSRWKCAAVSGMDVLITTVLRQQTGSTGPRRFFATSAEMRKSPNAS